jgi:hypothetical protein
VLLETLRQFLNPLLRFEMVKGCPQGRTRIPVLSGRFLCRGLLEWAGFAAGALPLIIQPKYQSSFSSRRRMEISSAFIEMIHADLHMKLPVFESLIIQRVRNAHIGISHSLYNQAPKKEHLMKSGIANQYR